MENEMELMDYEEMETENEVVETEESSLSTGAVVAIVAGVGAAIGAGVLLVKKLWAKHKAKKELRQPDDVVEVTDEDIEDVTK